jgi:hypothetical protein
VAKVSLAKIAPHLASRGRDLPEILDSILGGAAVGDAGIALAFWMLS